MVFDYLEGGAEDENGLRRNAEAFDCLQLRPFRLRDVSRRSLSTKLFGREIAAPLVVAPTGLNGVLWPNGDLALARAAAKANIPFALSTASNATMEEIADKAGGDIWFQPLRDPTRACRRPSRARDGGGIYDLGAYR